MRSLFFACLGLSVFWGHVPCAHAASYTFTDLGTIRGGYQSIGYDINQSGNIAGFSLTQGYGFSHAFYYDGTMHEIGTLGGTESFGYGLNIHGHVTGTTVLTGNSAYRAFLYDGTLHDLGTLGGNDSYGYAINDAGHVTGDSLRAGNSVTHAFYYDGTMHDIGTLGGTGSAGRAINSKNQIAGYSDTSLNRASHAFLYDGTMHDLGTLGGTNSTGLAINDLGWVTGYSRTSANRDHAFFYDGTIHDLGAIGTDSYGQGINSFGHITGSTYPAGVARAFIYKAGLGMVDLNTLVDMRMGWVLSEGLDINDAGQITGWATIAGPGENGGGMHAFLLTPVPEPAGILMGCLAIVGVCFAARNDRPRCVVRRQT